MYTDPIIEEIRKFRDEYAARFNYVVKAMLADIKRRQKEACFGLGDVPRRWNVFGSTENSFDS